jgi:hypothetical protein
MSKELQLVFPSGKIKYFNDGTLDEETMAFRAHIFQQTQAKFWSVIFECFAIHYDFLRVNVANEMKARDEDRDKEESQSIRKLKAKFAVKAVETSHGNLVHRGEKHPYACFPDAAIDELDGLLRSLSGDVSAINWFCYQCAKRSFRDICDASGVIDVNWSLKSIIDKVEREQITEIISKQHIIHYPRPADARQEYLDANGVEKLVLVLA